MQKFKRILLAGKRYNDRMNADAMTAFFVHEFYKKFDFQVSFF